MLELPDTTSLEHELRELRQELATCTRAVAARVLFPRQLLIWQLFTEEWLSPAEIARRLDVSPCAVHFSLHGNRRYRDGQPVRRVNGSIATLKHHAPRDPRIVELLERIQGVKQQLEAHEWRTSHEWREARDPTFKSLSEATG